MPRPGNTLFAQARPHSVQTRPLSAYTRPISVKGIPLSDKVFRGSAEISAQARPPSILLSSGHFFP